MEPPTFRIGRLSHVLVTFAGPARPAYDNELRAKVSVVSGGFRGAFDAYMQADKIARFRDPLQLLYDKLLGRALLETMEH